MTHNGITGAYYRYIGVPEANLSAQKEITGKMLAFVRGIEDPFAGYSLMFKFGMIIANRMV